MGHLDRCDYEDGAIETETRVTSMRFGKEVVILDCSLYSSS